MDVICDTNVWYDISEGRLDKEYLKGYKLHSTWVNLVELARSPNITKDLPLLQRTVKALYENHANIFEINPIEFIIKKQFPNYVCKDNQYQLILPLFEKLMKLDTYTEVEEDHIKQMENSIEDYKSSLQKTADDVNSHLPGIRQRIKGTTGKKVHRTKNSIPIFFDLINIFVEQYSKGEVKLDVKTYPWDEIELFVKIWDVFFKELEVSQQKFKPNDWLDLFNMVYVGPTEKYMTAEKQWIRLIESDEATLPYLIKIK